MTSTFALKATAIGALFLIATAAQAQRRHGGSDFDPAYATHFGFAPGDNSGPYAYADSNRYDSNSTPVPAGAPSSVQHARSYNPAARTQLEHDGRRHSRP
jgi:hypothetical protein